DLHVVRVVDLVVTEPGRDVHARAGYEPDEPAVLDGDVFPAVEAVDDLDVARVVVPAGLRLRSRPGTGDRHVELAVGGLRDSHVSPREERPHSLAEVALGVGGMTDRHG